MLLKEPGSTCQHRWFSGRMLACHAGGPGSIPGRCIFFTVFHYFQPPPPLPPEEQTSPKNAENGVN